MTTQTKNQSLELLRAISQLINEKLRNYEFDAVVPMPHLETLIVACTQLQNILWIFDSLPVFMLEQECQRPLPNALRCQSLANIVKGDYAFKFIADVIEQKEKHPTDGFDVAIQALQNKLLKQPRIDLEVCGLYPILGNVELERVSYPRYMAALIPGSDSYKAFVELVEQPDCYRLAKSISS